MLFFWCIYTQLINIQCVFAYLSDTFIVTMLFCLISEVVRRHWSAMDIKPLKLTSFRFHLKNKSENTCEIKYYIVTYRFHTVISLNDTVQ